MKKTFYVSSDISNDKVLSCTLQPATTKKCIFKIRQEWKERAPKRNIEFFSLETETWASFVLIKFNALGENLSFFIASFLMQLEDSGQNRRGNFGRKTFSHL